MKKDLNKQNFSTHENVLYLRQQQRIELHHKLEALATVLTEAIFEEEMQFTEEYRRERMKKMIQSLLGSVEEDGWLQEWMNFKMDNILLRLQEEMKGLTAEEKLVYCYSAAGFSNKLSAVLAGLSSDNAASVIKTRLRQDINKLKSDNKEEYLSLLPRKSCRIGEEMLYLHNL